MTEFLDHLKDVNVVTLLAIFGLGAWLRSEHRKAVREIIVEERNTEDNKRMIRDTVAEAATGMVEPIKDAVAEQRRSSIAQGDRIGKLEQWQARADAALSVIAKQQEHLGRLDRWVIEFGKVLKRAKLTDPEELTPP